MIDLLRSLGTAPRFHGNGFVQLPLPSGRRLHVWHPMLPPIPGHNATIHNHVWDMQSRVLLGHLLHVTYEMFSAVFHMGQATHDIYEVGEQAPDTRSGRCVCRVTGEYTMAAGSVCVFPEGQWHESHMAYPDTITATIMEKRAAREDARPLVACPVGETPTDAFAPEHQPLDLIMWRAVEAATHDMTPSARRELEEALR